MNARTYEPEPITQLSSKFYNTLIIETLDCQRVILFRDEAGDKGLPCIRTPTHENLCMTLIFHVIFCSSNRSAQHLGDHKIENDQYLQRSYSVLGELNLGWLGACFGETDIVVFTFAQSNGRSSRAVLLLCCYNEHPLRRSWISVCYGVQIVGNYSGLPASCPAGCFNPSWRALALSFD